MTNDTYSGNRQIYVGIEDILTHLIGFHENNPQVWGFLNLEYQFLPVICCASAFIS